MVWEDVEQFLRTPSVVIERLQARMVTQANDSSRDRERLSRLRSLMDGKVGERSKVVALYWRGKLNDAELDQQVDEIDKETAGLSAQIGELESKLAGVDSNGAVLDNAEELLARLRKRLDQPLTWERKRQLVKLLVEGIRIATIRDGEKRQNVVTVTYRFPCAAVACMDRGSCNKRDLSMKPERRIRRRIPIDGENNQSFGENFLVFQVHRYRGEPFRILFRLRFRSQ